MAPIEPARRTARVHYAVRDVVLTANEAKAAGKELLYLNIGDPNQFDFSTPEHIMEAICRAVRDNRTSYTPSAGIPEALEAIRAEAESHGISSIQDIFIGTGGSECIETALTALANDGERVLTPSPGYPLYSAVLGKLGCEEVPYFLDEENGWQPDLADIEQKIDSRTRALVLINPNNPTGSVCARETLEALVEIALRHNLVIFSDEIYDKLILDGGHHISIASLSPEVPVLTFNGLSKSYLGPGLRMGWCISSGPKERLGTFIEAMHRLLRARLCASHIVQHAIVPALTGDQSHLTDVCTRLTRRRDLTVEGLNAIEGISCVAPRGAFYAFPRLEDCPEGDEEFVKGLIRTTGVVVVHGSGFGQRPGTNHFRVVFLPPEEILKRAFNAIGEYLASR